MQSISAIHSGLVAIVICAMFALRALPSGQSSASHINASATDVSSPEALLMESERIGAAFSADDRDFQLFRLAETAAELGSESSRQLVRKWAIELFRRAEERPRDWNRGAFEKNAAALLASVDPDQAFLLLPKVDAPDSGSHPPPPEDLRAFGARTIFVEYWKRHGIKALPRIREMALSFCRSGEYPFPAMAGLLSQLGSTDREESFARQTLEDALRCYQQSNNVQSADRDFIEFLESRWQSLDRASRLAVLRASVAKLTLPRSSDPSSTFAGRVTTSKGVASFDNEQLLLLYRILGKIRDIDADWASKLEDEYPALAQAGGASGKSEQTSQMTVENPGNSASHERVDSVLAKRLQAGTLAQLRRAAPNDLGHAMRYLSQLTDPELRVEGMAAIAVAQAATDPKAARSILEAADEIAKGIPADVLSQARANLSLAEAAAALPNQPLYRSVLDAGFVAAEESVQEDIDMNPDRPYYLARGMNELSSLTELDMRIDPTDGIGRVSRMQDGEMKAFLLIDCAEGLIRSNSRNAGIQSKR